MSHVEETEHVRIILKWVFVGGDTSSVACPMAGSGIVVLPDLHVSTSYLLSYISRNELSVKQQPSHITCKNVKLLGNLCVKIR